MSNTIPQTITSLFKIAFEFVTPAVKGIAIGTAFTEITIPIFVYGLKITTTVEKFFFSRIDDGIYIKNNTPASQTITVSSGFSYTPATTYK